MGGIVWVGGLACAGGTIIRVTNSVINGELILSWANPLFVLQSAPEVTGPYTTIPDATSPYTNTLSGGQQYFRLKY